jgi:GAF domain-containing protein
MSKSASKKKQKYGKPRAESTPADGSGKLEHALTVAAAAGELRRQDHLRLLEAIVGTAVRVIDASAGSLMLIDPATDELEFQVAVGPGSEEIKRFRVPIGQGIAGFVASSGQALAIADTSQDARFARQIAEGSGYVPKNLLCVPLVMHGEVIGVMELLDKKGGDSPFTPGDIAVLSSFGEQAALTIDLSLHAQSLERLLAAASHMEGEPNSDAAVAIAVAGALTASGYERTLSLARQVAAIGAAGEREARLAGAVLQAVTGYLSSDPLAEISMAAGLMPIQTP